MKTLCVSDLDGTLLNASAELDEYTLNAVNRYTSNGGIFTVATARTSETVRHIMSGAKLNAPQILMNGVFAYDGESKKFVMSRIIDRETVRELISIVNRFSLSGFMYIARDGFVDTYYTRLDTHRSREFKEERERKYNKSFTYTADFNSLELDRAVYFSVCERRELLDEAAYELKKLPGLNVVYHSDVYDTGLWYLDICAASASKRSALDYLRAAYGYDRIIAFGDNYNDLPLFEGADVKIAVGNAVDELKKAADLVIGSNTSHGVADWLLGNMEQL